MQLSMTRNIFFPDFTKDYCPFFYKIKINNLCVKLLLTAVVMQK